MAKNIHGLNNAARKTQENLDRRAQEQGEQLARRVTSSSGAKSFFAIILAIIFAGIAFSVAMPFMYVIAGILSAFTGGFISFDIAQIVVGIVVLYLCFSAASGMVGK